MMTVPAKGMPAERVLATMRAIRGHDARWQEGKTWSLVFHAGEPVTDLLQKAYTLFFSENGLNPMAFPSLKKFEAEVVAMTAALLGGDDETVGNMTSGGTESILMAVKTARDWARAARPQVAAPEMVLPATAHPAFDKAAHYFGVQAVHVPVQADFRADVAASRAALTPDTILMVGSAPAYPQGVVDPIGELAQVARENDILFHVDACVGGFMLPFVRKLGYAVPDFDFGVPGVTQAQRATRRERWAWYLYDFGNSAYAAVVLLAVYSAYFQGQVVGGAEGSRLWGLAVAIAMLTVALMSPVLGAIADFAGSKKQFLLFFTAMACLFTAGLFFATPGAVLFGLDQQRLIVFVILVQVTNVVGAFAFGQLVDRFGGKRSLTLSLLLMIGVVLGLYFTRTATGFFLIGAVTGVAMAGAQSVSRTMVAIFAPPGQSAEFYGFFAVAGRTSSFIGPAVFGWIAAEAALWFQARDLGVDQAEQAGLRLAILSIAAFLLVGLVLLAFVNEHKAREAADQAP